MQLAEKCGRSFQPEHENQRCICFQASDLTSNCGRDDKCPMTAGSKKGKTMKKVKKDIFKAKCAFGQQGTRSAAEKNNEYPLSLS